MSISVDKYKSGTNRSGSFPAALCKVQNIARWLAGLLTLTEAERLQAGIYLGGGGRDE